VVQIWSRYPPESDPKETFVVHRVGRDLFFEGGDLGGAVGALFGHASSQSAYFLRHGYLHLLSGMASELEVHSLQSKL